MTRPLTIAIFTGSRVLLAIVHTGDLTNARGLALAAEGIQ